jgi:hypothetical protein
MPRQQLGERMGLLGQCESGEQLSWSSHFSVSAEN